MLTRLQLVVSHNSVMHTQLYAYHTATLDVADVDDNVDVRSPRLELSLPRYKSWQWNHQQEWTIDVVRVHQHWQERNDLNGLTESHLISKYYSVLPTQPRHSQNSTDIQASGSGT